MLFIRIKKCKSFFPCFYTFLAYKKHFFTKNVFYWPEFFNLRIKYIQYMYQVIHIKKKINMPSTTYTCNICGKEKLDNIHNKKHINSIRHQNALAEIIKPFKEQATKIYHKSHSGLSFDKFCTYATAYDDDTDLDVFQSNSSKIEKYVYKIQQLNEELKNIIFSH